MKRVNETSSWVPAAARVAAFMLVSAGAVVAPTAAHAAKPYEHFSWHEDADVVTERCSVPVRIQVSEEGKVLARATGRAGMPQYTVSWSGHATWTNIESGLTFTFDWQSREQEVRAVDNGDGTTTLLYQQMDREHVNGPDGQRLFLWVGLDRASVLVDNGDTLNNPFDDSLISVDVLSFKGRPDTGGDFCEAFLKLTGATP